MAVQRLNPLMPVRKEVPILVILLGTLITLVSITVDFFGISTKGFSQKQLMLVCFGVGIFSIGIAMDFVINQRYKLKGHILNKLDWCSFFQFLGVFVQLSLLVFVIREFGLVNEMFHQKIMGLTFLGFLTHFFLPFRYRLPFFMLLSFAGILLVLGLYKGVWLIGIGLILITICHLPISYRARVATILITGSFLSLLRLELIKAPCLLAVWPILGSMFMFRLIIYLYDLKHEKKPVSITNTLSYFFLLPNVVFPFFPVVDYKVFNRTYYDGDRYWIYQKGIVWTLRGITHLLLYRIVYYYMVIAPSDIANVSDLIQYIFSNYMLYLRVSGQFHLVIGLLHLFGFNLPETHHLYYLASSFTDFWRRINIYWKDFMMKVFYYPSFFPLRKYGGTTALVLSTFFVFIFTWFFHSYQYFWLRGSFPLLLTDILFWAILAILVALNSLYEAKYGRKRVLGKTKWTIRNAILIILKTICTFTVICILWSLWTSSSISEWLSIWKFSGANLTEKTIVNTIQIQEILAILLALILFYGTFRFSKFIGRTKGSDRNPTTFIKSALANTALIIFLYAIGNQTVYSNFGLQAQEIIRDLRISGLNRRDAALLKRNYYEDLIEVSRFNSQLSDLYSKMPKNWPRISETTVGHYTGDFLKFELRPMSSIFFHGKSFRTNQWGMRDKDYMLDKPQNTFRIAVIGPSTTMGDGVGDNDTFESIVEERLNNEFVKVGPYARYEILNFGVSSYSSVQTMLKMETSVFDFNPDMIIFTAHLMDEEEDIEHIAERVNAGVEIPYPYLANITRRAGIGQETSRSVAVKLLKPFGTEIRSWVYHRMVEKISERGILPAWVYLPEPTIDIPKETIKSLVKIADEAGFITMDFSNIFDNIDAKTIHVAEWDLHPNEKGHKIIADQLYLNLLHNKDVIFQKTK